MTEPTNRRIQGLLIIIKYYRYPSSGNSMCVCIVTYKLQRTECKTRMERENVNRDRLFLVELSLRGGCNWCVLSVRIGSTVVGVSDRAHWVIGVERRMRKLLLHCCCPLLSLLIANSDLPYRILFSS
jgi:hypothetical protein